MNFRVCIAWLLFSLPVGSHILHRATDVEATYVLALACFFMLVAIWERKP